MNCDNQQVIYCDDGEYPVYCSICDKNHTNNIRKRESFQVISHY